ncbi:hypothetical protein KK2020170_05420 [Flavobacterium okayamense]|uniref:NADH dehydrogenase subunit 6 n=1 Tax=Flavobacterium okayamense TaxID=2830782 RepID=A0ABN6HSX5_9FLAO|nr:hypothetical protein KK2020170_05420 [Flavobacterium okayamense]
MKYLNFFKIILVLLFLFILLPNNKAIIPNILMLLSSSMMLTGENLSMFEVSMSVLSVLSLMSIFLIFLKNKFLTLFGILFFWLWIFYFFLNYDSNRFIKFSILSYISLGMFLILSVFIVKSIFDKKNKAGSKI